MEEIKLKPRFEELTFPTSNPDEMAGRYLALDVRREWDEQFIDKGSGEIVNVTRSELVMRRGEFLSPENVSSLCFYLQCGEIKSVTVTNVKRTAKCVEAGKDTIWQITVSGGGDAKKRRYILFAQSLDQAIRIAKDYLEQTLSGDIKIEAAKSFSSCTVIQDSLEERKKDGEDTAAGRLEFYNVTACVATRDFAQDTNWLVMATSVDDAKMRIRRYLDNLVKERSKDASFDASNWEGYEITVQTGTRSGVDSIIPKEFSEAYFKFEDAKKLSMDHNKFLKMLDKAFDKKEKSE